MLVHPATLVLILGLLLIVGFVVLTRWDEPPASEREASEADLRNIPGVDWVALALWTRDYVAAKGSEGEWGSLDDVLKSLDTFARAANEPESGDAMDQEHFRVLGEGIKRWGNAGEDRPDQFLSALMKASDEPVVWARLIGALGPVLMAGAHEHGSEIRPQFAEQMQRVQIELAGGVRGEARVKLEMKREKLQDMLATIDRIPAPSEAAHKRWENFTRAIQRKRDAESDAEEPADD